MLSGKKANKTGNALEKFVESILDNNGYSKTKPVDFEQTKYIDKPCYATQKKFSPNIYGLEYCVDFIIFHPIKWRENLIIECKWQQISGSVDEKYPFLALNIKTKYPTQTIVLIDGNGMRKGAVKWLRNEIGENLIDVMSMQEFMKWCNDGNI